MAQQRRENEGVPVTSDEINYMVYRYLQESGGRAAAGIASWSKPLAGVSAASVCGIRY